jgi:alpha/beta superfamily hydrolase
MRGASQERAGIAGPAGRIEAVVDHPTHETPAAVAVICHPHPLYHGTMTNKVVHTLARTTVQLGHPAVRFNFRGVGGSEGAYAEGAGEAMDAKAVVDWSRARWPDAELWLGGFSFGAFVALSIAAEVAPARLLTVAPPLNRFDMSSLTLPRCPWLIIQGRDDELVDAAAVEAWAAALDPAPRLCLLADTDHFFHGRLTLLREVAAEFLGPAVPEEGDRC